MAKQKDTTPEDPTENQPPAGMVRASDVAALAQAIIDNNNQHAPRKIIPFGMHKSVTPFNPTGKKRRTLKRATFQNGYRINERFLHDDEIAMLDQIKTGSYLDDRIQVVEVREGAERHVHIRYKNKTADQRMELAAAGVPTFRLMLSHILEEQGQQAAVKAARD